MGHWMVRWLEGHLGDSCWQLQHHHHCIIGKEVKPIFIACMALMDQWHLSDGIGCRDVVRCVSHLWWWISRHPWTWCNHLWSWCIHCWWVHLLSGHDCGEFLDCSYVLDFVGRKFWYITPKYLDEVCCRCNGEVMLQNNWDLAVGWVQAPGVREAEAARCRNVKLEVSVVVGGGSNVEAIGCMWRPRSL